MSSILKRILTGVVALLAVVVLAIAVLHFYGANRFDSAPDITVAAVSVPADADAVERGAQLAAISSCTDCHGSDLGGTRFIDEAPIGYIPAPNLTAGAGGVGNSYTAEDWDRAIRHGIGADGRILTVMASDHYAHYGDADLGVLIAYLESVPPVDNELGERALQFPGSIIFGVLAYGDVAATTRIDHESVGGPAPDTGPTAEYGEYLINIASCASCHGENMAGGTDQNAPVGPNITPGGVLNGYDQAAFDAALRTGIAPDGRDLSEGMPWQSYAGMSDTEIEALWAYLTTLPATPTNE